MQGALSEKHLASRIDKVDMPGLPAPYQGKVRENFSLADGRRVIIASDRLSAFDQILTAIPFKGEVLTQIARFWFEETADICPNHVLNYPDPNVLVARELRMLPVEIVVRNYLTGTTSTSIWPAYKAGQRELYGVIFPDGMKKNQKLAEPVLTPTTKALDGGHDEPISPSQIVARGLMSAEQWAVVSAYSLKIFARGQKIAADRGLILVDTKYEFGVDRDGKILLADEIHTPDSSRYWLADSYPAAFENGQSPQSFDKDFIRRWVTARCDPYKDPIPVIPNDVILKTAQVYIDAFEKITGKTFVVGSQSDEPLKRMQKNLQPYIAA